MSHLSSILDSLPAPYSVAEDSLLAQVLSLLALEMEAYEEDLDRMRQTHWINFCFRLEDAEKLAALMGIERFDWENLPEFRVRLLATVKARLSGAVEPNDIRQFVYDYLFQTEQVTGATLVPGLQSVSVEQAYSGIPERPLFRTLSLVENPTATHESAILTSRNGNVPYLFRWEEANHGLDESLVRIDVAGVIGRRTVGPVIVNLTTGDMIGFRGRVPFGKMLKIDFSDPASRVARATMDGAEVTESLFSMQGFELGKPFTPEQLDEHPLAPRMRRGINQWIFLALGMYDLRGLNRFFNSLATSDLREAAFNQSNFDQALFPSGTMAKLWMSWQEAEPAAFEVRVPRTVVLEPDASDLHELVARGLADTISVLRVAGVRSSIVLMPLQETQRQVIRATIPWIVLDRETGSPGQKAELSLGGQFGETPLGGTRFE
jgi:hypothetical protein